MDTKNLHKQISNTREDASFVESLLPILEKLPGHPSSANQPFMIFVSSWADFRQVRHAFDGRLTPEARHYDPDGSIYFSYLLDGHFRFCINCDLAAGGKSCQRVQVGEKVVPLYRIVCNK